MTYGDDGDDVISAGENGGEVEGNDGDDRLTVRNVQDPKQKDLRNEMGGSIGGALVKNKLFYFASYSPRLIRRTNDYAYASNDTGSIDQKRNDTQLFGNERRNAQNPPNGDQSERLSEDANR